MLTARIRGMIVERLRSANPSEKWGVPPWKETTNIGFGFSKK